VKNQGGTSTGSWIFECWFYTRLLPVCSLQSGGAFYVGQAYVVQGSSTVLSTGSWEVGVQQ
jgi:hypothetical protein